MQNDIHRGPVGQHSGNYLTLKCAMHVVLCVSMVSFVCVVCVVIALLFVTSGV